MPTYVADDNHENTSETKNIASELFNKGNRTSQETSSDVSETPRVRYEGYKFFKADPLPGQKSTWTKVERMEMHLSEGELCKKAQKRANKVSAAQQYQTLSEACQAHINQLIHEKRQTNIQGDWSCVYAKQREKASKPRNARPSDYEIVSMQVILMQRPLQTTSYPRTPMGDLVDLEPPFGSSLQQDESDGGEESHETVDYKLKSQKSQLRHRSLPPYRRSRNNHMWRSGTTAEGDQPIPELPTRPFTANIAQELHESNYSTDIWAFNSKKASVKTKNSPREDVCADGFEPSVLQDDTAEVALHRTSSNGSSTIGAPSQTVCRCQGSPLLQPRATRSANLNMSHWECDSDYNHDRGDIGRNLARGGLSNGPASAYHDDRMSAIHATDLNVLPAKRSRTFYSEDLNPSFWRKKIRIDMMDEQEMRSRLLDCEARILQWEKTLHDQTRMLRMSIQNSPGIRCCQESST